MTTQAVAASASGVPFAGAMLVNSVVPLVVARARGGTPPSRDKLLLLLSRSSVGATGLFQAPGSRPVELGTLVEI